MEAQTLTDLYYSNAIGVYPSDEKEILKTKSFFEYLIEAGCSKQEIIELILFDLKNENHLTINSLPDKLWDNSLLDRDTFYYHNELQILSPAPTLTESFPFYLEMKIKYTEKDVLNYFIKTFNIKEKWIDEDKEIGAIKYLLNNYKKYDFVQPIDYLLSLIYYVAGFNNNKINTFFDLRNYELDFTEVFEKDIISAKEHNKNNIIYRIDVL